MAGHEMLAVYEATFFLLHYEGQHEVSNFQAKKIATKTILDLSSHDIVSRWALGVWRSQAVCHDSLQTEILASPPTIRPAAVERLWNVFSSQIFGFAATLLFSISCFCVSRGGSGSSGSIVSQPCDSRELFLLSSSYVGIDVMVKNL